MANRGKTHNNEVYCIKDLERLGSSKMETTSRGKMATVQCPSSCRQGSWTSRGEKMADEDP